VAEGQRRTRRKFSAEFKRDAVELVLTGGKTVAEAARDLGIYDSTLGNWVKQARIDRGQQEGLSTEERARMRELEQENTKLRMERHLLKRAHEPSGSGSRPSDPLPLCRLPEGRRVPGSGRLPSRRGVDLGVLRVVPPTRCWTDAGPADRS
jgi:transposase-like protein